MSARAWVCPPRAERSLAKNAALLMGAKVIALVLSFALPLLLVRHLSQTEFGLYKQIFLIINTTAIVLPLGFAMSAFYFFPRHPSRRPEVALNILLFYLAIATGVFLTILLAPGVLATIVNGPELTEHGSLVAVVVLLWVIASVFEIITIANGDMKSTTAVIVGAQLSKTILMTGAATLFGSISALIYAALLQGIVQTACLFLYLRRRLPGFWRKFDWALMRSQLAYAVPMGCAGLLYSTQMELHHYFVSSRFGAATYAIYAVGCFQVPLLPAVSEAVASVMIPEVSRLQSEGRRREIVVLTARMIRKMAVIYLPVYVLLLVTGREFITLLFTRQYLDSWPIFAVNLTLIPLAIMGSAYDPVVRAYPQYLGFLLRTRLVLLVVLVTVLWFGTEHFGPIGAIVAMVAVNIVERPVIAVRMGRVVGVSWRDLRLLEDVGKIALAAMAAGTVAALVRGATVDAAPVAVLGTCGVAFAAVYIATLVGLRVSTVEERLALRHELARLARVVWWKRASLGREPS